MVMSAGHAEDPHWKGRWRSLQEDLGVRRVGHARCSIYFPFQEHCKHKPTLPGQPIAHLSTVMQHVRHKDRQAPQRKQLAGMQVTASSTLRSLNT
eukprot:5058412-Amphidinium_carterae.1